MLLAFVYPGQGTQRLRMGSWMLRSSAEARAVFARASSTLGFDVETLCTKGSMAVLTETENAQPATFTCNAAAHSILEAHGVRPDMVGGHSVGEFSALWAARVLSFDDALRLVSARAHLMAGVRKRGSMIAVMGLAEADVERCCAEARVAGPVVVALRNGPGNVVVSGATAGVELCLRLAMEAGARRCVRLAASSGFHSPLFEGIRDEWAGIVRTVTLDPPEIPVAMNVPGRIVSQVDEIREAVIDQLTMAVRWTDCIESLAKAGAEAFVESGDSRVLSALNRAILPAAPCFTMSDPATPSAIFGRPIGSRSS